MGSLQAEGTALGSHLAEGSTVVHDKERAHNGVIAERSTHCKAGFKNIERLLQYERQCSPIPAGDAPRDWSTPWRY